MLRAPLNLKVVVFVLVAGMGSAAQAQDDFTGISQLLDFRNVLRSVSAFVAGEQTALPHDATLATMGVRN